MNNSSAKKAEQLGMPFGTANGKLRKMILFQLVQRFGLDDCYRCGLKIETIESFTVEHKEAWLDVDPALFWDLDNIAFSHLSCNAGAARPRPTPLVCYECKTNPPHRSVGGKLSACSACRNRYKKRMRMLRPRYGR